MEAAVVERIHAWLNEQGVSVRRIVHGPTRTSEESAAARGEPLRVGGKALLMKIGDDFRLLVLSAALKLDSEAVKQHFGVKRIRFATADELRTITGLVPGSVPPFGLPMLPFPLYADQSIQANDRIAFNAGSLTESMVMSVADYLRVAKPVIFRFGSIAEG